MHQDNSLIWNLFMPAEKSVHAKDLVLTKAFKAYIRRQLSELSKISGGLARELRQAS